MKTCSTCKIPKPLAEFGDDARATDGKQSRCYACNRERDNARYRRNPALKKARNARHWGSLPAEERLRRRRRYYLRGVYGISQEAFDRLLVAQGFSCALCQKPHRGKRTQFLQVDHDHKTGLVRGLLCNECNTAIGRLGDDVPGLRRALEYLTRPRLVPTLSLRAKRSGSNRS